MKWRNLLLCLIASCLVLLFVVGKTRGSKTVVKTEIEVLAQPAKWENFEDTVQEAHDIVRGQVSEVICEERIDSFQLEMYEKPEDVPVNEREVYTVYTIQVLEVYKGNAKPGDELKYQHWGGETERLIYKVSPSPKKLEVGTECVFLLTEKGNAVGFDQGVYTIHGDNLNGDFSITFDMLEALKE